MESYAPIMSPFFTHLLPHSHSITFFAARQLISQPFFFVTSPLPSISTSLLRNPTSLSNTMSLPMVSSFVESVHHFCNQMKRFYFVRMMHLALLRTCDEHLVFVLVCLRPVHNPYILPSNVLRHSLHCMIYILFTLVASPSSLTTRKEEVDTWPRGRETAEQRACSSNGRQQCSRAPALLQRELRGRQGLDSSRCVGGTFQGLRALGQRSH